MCALHHGDLEETCGQILLADFVACSSLMDLLMKMRKGSFLKEVAKPGPGASAFWIVFSSQVGTGGLLGFLEDPVCVSPGLFLVPQPLLKPGFKFCSLRLF